MRRLALLFVFLAGAIAIARSQAPVDWARVEEETLRHFQTLVRFDTADPPGNEQPAADYLKSVLEAEGIPARIYTLEPNRPNVVARLAGSGRKRPLLIVGHTDVVNVDPKKWTFPPFSATRDGGYIYGRGTVDDKDNLTGSLMIMLLLKRLNVPLDRDVIFLAESGEEGTTRVGIQYIVNEHYADVDAEYCLAEGGGVTRTGGRAVYSGVQTLEKIPYAISLTARGPAGHGSVPLQTNAIAHLSSAVARVADWRPPVRLNETTSAYFKRLAEISAPEQAAQYRAVLDPAKIWDADKWFLEHEPRHASMLRTSVSPNIITAGYRINVIPSEATAQLDVRGLPGENMPAFLEEVKKVVNDPTIDVAFAPRDTRPPGAEARIDSEMFKALESAGQKIYNVPTLPEMSTGATDMAYLRAKGMQCYGIGPAIDTEDSPKGFGAHSDQERILESELHRFVKFYWEVVTNVAGRR
jgi:acetylornithine deacetylase/succinyl-diaminopimelate desuccinylase-like protein